MKAYELVMQNPKLKTYQKISWLVVAMNFFAFIYIAYQLMNTEEFRWPLLGAILIAVFVIIFQLKKRKDPGSQPQFLFPFFVIMFTWVQLNNYWFVLAILLIVVFENMSKKKLVVRIEEEKIIYPSFPKKEFHWQEIKNLLLKDDLLTIDFKNNKLIQALVVETDVNEEEFNEFCRERLTRQMTTQKRSTANK